MTQQWWYSGPRAGLEIDDARHWRYRLSDGEVTEMQADRDPRVVAAAGEVSRVAVVPAESVARRERILRSTATYADEVLVVRSDDRVAVAVRIRDLASDQVLSAADLRASARLSDGAQAIGLPLEAADAADVAAVASVPATRGRVARSLSVRSRAHGAAAVLMLVGSAAAVVTGSGSVAAHAAWAVVAAAAAAVAADRALLHRRLRRVWGVPASEGRQVVAVTDGAGIPRWQRDAQLQIGSDDVVVSIGPTEQWVPGPARHGVATCVVSSSGVAFVDARDAVLLPVPAGVWSAADIVDACSRVGIATREVPQLAETLGITAQVEQWRADGPMASLTFAQRGDVSGVALVLAPSAAALTAAAVLLDPDQDLSGIDAVTGGVALVALLVCGALSVAKRLMARRLRSST